MDKTSQNFSKLNSPRRTRPIKDMSGIKLLMPARPNRVIAMAAATVIVEAENIVPVGVISPDHVMTPAPVVDYLIASK